MSDADREDQLSKDERVDAAKKRFEEMKKKMKKKKKAHSIDFSKHELAQTADVTEPPTHPPIGPPKSVKPTPTGEILGQVVIHDEPQGQPAPIEPEILESVPISENEHIPTEQVQEVSIEEPELPTEVAQNEQTQPELEEVNIETDFETETETKTETDDLKLDPQHVTQDPEQESAPIDVTESQSIAQPQAAYLSPYTPQAEFVPTAPKTRENSLTNSAVSSSHTASPRRYQLTPEDLFGPSTSSPEQNFLTMAPRRTSQPVTSPRVPPLALHTQLQSQPPFQATPQSQAQAPTQPQTQTQGQSVFPNQVTKPRNALVPKVDPLDLFGPSSLADPFAPDSKIEPPKSQKSYLEFFPATSRQQDAKNIGRSNSKDLNVYNSEVGANTTGSVRGNSVTSTKSQTTFEDLFGPSKTDGNFDDIFKANATTESERKQSIAEIFEGEEEEVKSDVEEYFGMTQASPTRKSFEDVLKVVEPTPAPKALTAEDLFGSVSPEPNSAADDLFAPYPAAEKKTEPVNIEDEDTNEAVGIQKSLTLAANLEPSVKDTSSTDGLLEVDLNEPELDKQVLDENTENAAKSNDFFAEIALQSEPEGRAILNEQVEAEAQSAGNLEPENNEQAAEDRETSESTKVTDVQNPNDEEPVSSVAETDAQSTQETTFDSAAEIERLKKIIEEQDAIIKRQREENTNIKLSRMDLNDKIMELEEIIEELREGREPAVEDYIEDEIEDEVEGQADEVDDAVIIKPQDMGSQEPEPAPSASAPPVESPAPQASDVPFKPDSSVIDSLFSETVATSTGKSDVHDLFPDTTAELEGRKPSLLLPASFLSPAKEKPAAISSVAAVPAQSAPAPSVTAPVDQSQSTQTPSQRVVSAGTRQKTASGISDFRERLLVWKGWQIDMTQWDGSNAPKVAI